MTLDEAKESWRVKKSRNLISSDCKKKSKKNCKKILLTPVQSKLARSSNVRWICILIWLPADLRAALMN